MSRDFTLVAVTDDRLLVRWLENCMLVSGCNHDHRLSELSYAEQVLLNELPENLAWIVIAIVSGIDQIPLSSRAELEQHLAKGGGGPFEYVVQGVQLATESGGKVTLPPPLLTAEQAQLVAAGLSGLAVGSGAQAERLRL